MTVKDSDFVPELDFVMELNGKLIVHIMFVRVAIEADDGRVQFPPKQKLKLSGPLFD